MIIDFDIFYYKFKLKQEELSTDIALINSNYEYHLGYYVPIKFRDRPRYILQNQDFNGFKAIATASDNYLFVANNWFIDIYGEWAVVPENQEITAVGSNAERQILLEDIPTPFSTIKLDGGEIKLGNQFKIMVDFGNQNYIKLMEY